MGKYVSLGEYLRGQKNTAITMTFVEVERIIGHKLPRSARYPAWWSNNPSNNVMTKVWLEAGFKTEQVDIEGRKLVFRRVQPTQPQSAERGTSTPVSSHRRPATTESLPTDTPVPSLIHPAFGSMRGLIQIAPGVDLTEPADPEWGKVYE